MLLTQLPDLLLVFAEFIWYKDAARLALASRPSLRALEEANNVLISKTFAGMELFCWRLKGALFQQLQEIIQPRRLVHVSACNCCKASFKSSMPVALDTAGCFFVRFWMGASNARNGCPCVGLVDAAEARQDLTKSVENVSKSGKASDPLEISCNPFSGKIYSSHIAEQQKSVVSDPPGKDMSPPCCWSADVRGWRSLEEEAMGSEGSSIGLGMIIQHGKVEFIRQGAEGWERSGVITDHLPRQILCCAFLVDFIGETTVTIEEVVRKRSCCAGNWPCSVHGELSPWTAYPPEESE